MAIASQTKSTSLTSADDTLASLAAILKDGETVLAVCNAEKRVPLVIRLMPFVPDLLTRAKKFMLVLTDERLIVVRLTNPLNKLKAPVVRDVLKSYRFDEIRHMVQKAGILTSRMLIHPISGRCLKLRGVSKSAGAELVRSFRAAIA